MLFKVNVKHGNTTRLSMSVTEMQRSSVEGPKGIFPSFTNEVNGKPQI